ncbi:MAG: molybdopterin-dependent oxidoreductase [Anaerolineales bacterium]|nr:molybdopterin-dependent oxidoreductase [Anaerolineales bacterium]
MTENKPTPAKSSLRLTRRDFLKIAGLGAALSGVPRLIRRESGLALSGANASVLTTCGECPAACGLIVKTVEGRPFQIEGNPSHPVNRGSLCPRSQAALQGLDNLERICRPLRQPVRGSGRFEALDWNAALQAVKNAMQEYRPSQVAFLLGLFPDHLFDFTRLLAGAMGGACVLRCSLAAEFEGRLALMDACQRLFGASKIPHFDLENAGVIFSFGANLTESWLSPGVNARRRGGYLVQFEPRRSLTAASADEWISIRPGSEAVLAQALGRLAAARQGDLPPAFASVDLDRAAQLSGLPLSEMERQAGIFANASHKLALPGGVSLGSANGVLAAEAILSLNILADNLGKPGGLHFLPDSPVYPQYNNRPSSLEEVNALVERMRAGQVKALFLHGVNPLKDLPRQLGFAQALEQVEQVILFAPCLDETAALADVVLPAPTPLESWGYQRAGAASDRMALSALQPVVAPLDGARSPVDVLLTAAQMLGGGLAARLPFRDEVDFLRQSVAVLGDQGGIYQASGMPSFWAHWLEYGGWWKQQAELLPPVPQISWERPLQAVEMQPAVEGELRLMPFLDMGEDSGENTWVEIHPSTAQRLGLGQGEQVKVVSPHGEIQAVVSLDPGVQPELIAVPLGRGANPLDLLGAERSEAGGLAFMETCVRVAPSR